MTSPADIPALRDEVIRLGPWHLDVEVVEGLSTRAFLDAPEGTYTAADQANISFISPRDAYRTFVGRLFPEGLAGRSMLDCACNCGGYAFWSKEMGASRCFGFDVRPEWIEQARFLLEHRSPPQDGIRFEVCDLYEVPKLGLEPFNLTMFKGIFYHLPDPIRGLKLVADLTTEVLVLNTASRNGLPDGALAVSEESETHWMSGVYGLNWFPTGPEVLKRVLKWMGFQDVKCTSWSEGGVGQSAGLGRIEVVASRKPGMLERLPDVTIPTDRAQSRQA